MVFLVITKFDGNIVDYNAFSTELAATFFMRKNSISSHVAMDLRAIPLDKQ